MKVFFFGLGYCAQALIRRMPSIEPSGTARSDEKVAALRAAGVEAYAFEGAHADPGIEDALKRAEAVVVSIPPREGDGPLDRFAEAFLAAPALRRVLYYSTIGVYGEHGEAWVDETSPTVTRNDRSLARLADETRWKEAGRAARLRVDILRLPGSTAPAAMRWSGFARARRGGLSRRPCVNRAHVDDIAELTRLVLEPASTARSGTSPTTSPHRHRT